MNVAKSLWAAVQGNPAGLVSLHKWATLFWIAATVPIAVFGSNSIPLIVALSVYAIVTGHWSAWQAARVEVKQDEVTEELQQDEPNAKAPSVDPISSRTRLP